MAWNVTERVKRVMFATSGLCLLALLVLLTFADMNGNIDGIGSHLPFLLAALLYFVGWIATISVVAQYADWRRFYGIALIVAYLSLPLYYVFPMGRY